MYGSHNGTFERINRSFQFDVRFSEIRSPENEAKKALSSEWKRGKDYNGSL